MTGAEYFETAKDFQKTQKVAIDRSLGALFQESLARQRGAKLLVSPVTAAVENHHRLLLAMAAVGQEFLSDAQSRYQ